MVKTTAGRMHLGTSKSANAYLYGWVRQSVPVASTPCYLYYDNFPFTIGPLEIINRRTALGFVAQPMSER
jgi:hypothetical protein